MKKNIFAPGILFSVSVGVLALATSPLLASQVCPIATGGEADDEGVSGTYVSNQTGQNNQGCNVLITLNANGSITITNPNGAISYDAGPDDNLIGIINNTGSAISSLALSSTTQDIFGFDLDGICSTTNASGGATGGGYTFSASGAGGTAPCQNITDPNQYGGPYVTFSGISSNQESGTVNFGNGGIAANGGTGWFSLEGPVDATLTTMLSNPAPEPASFALIGSGLAGLYFIRRRRKA